MDKGKKGKVNAIYYASKTLNEAQVNYATTEKELLVVVFTFEKFRSYIVNSKVIVRDRSRRPEGGGEWEPIKISFEIDPSAYIPKITASPQPKV